MKLIAYVEEGHELDIRPARAKRDWLDNYLAGHAYGCLPMLISNQHGWEICSPISFTVIWNGGKHHDCLAILPDDEHCDRIVSHFGAGIFSYSLPAVFRTEPGYDLVIEGPRNAPIDGAVAYSGTVENDWLVTSPAIHWQLTRTNHAIRFKKGQPLAQIYPQRRGELELVEPELRDLNEDPARATYVEAWHRERRAFNAALQDETTEEFKQRWPGHYRRGTDINGRNVSPDDHRTRLRLHSFADMRRPNSRKKE